MLEPTNDRSILNAAELLRAGRLVALPTETVYGLGADATNDKAVAEIFALKGRPQFNPLIVHVCDTEMAKRQVIWNDAAEKLARAFWPGPLTLVLRRHAQSNVSLLVSAGGESLGMRMPAHKAMLAVIRAANVPVAAPSANRSGRVSPTTAEHVQEEFGDAVSLILDGGACSIGLESSVLDISDDVPVLLRPGFVTREQLQNILGCDVVIHAGQTGDLKSPGMLASHYAPSLPVRMNATQVSATEALLAFGANVPQGAGRIFNLSASGDLTEAASLLFAGLRLLDSPEFSAIAVMAIPEEGLGAAITDRLRRAACR